MPVYPYTCCGNQFNMIDTRDTCPECGKEGTRNFVEQINPGFDQKHGRAFSVEGVREYFDVGAGEYFKTSEDKKAWMRKNNYRYAPNASAYESLW